VATWIGNKYY